MIANHWGNVELGGHQVVHLLRDEGRGVMFGRGEGVVWVGEGVVWAGEGVVWAGA